MKTLKTSLLALVVPLVALAQATVVVKEAEGQAAIVKGDEQKGFEEAKNQALRAAIEAAAGVRIDADSVVVNNQLVRDQIFSNTSGYVKKFDVLDKKVEKGVVTVKVKAEVITENLDKDITAARDLVKRMGRPTLIIVIQEQTTTLKPGAPVLNSENLAVVLTDSLKADGWDIKDEKLVNKSVKLEGAATLGATEMKVISDSTGAHYILYGKAGFRHQEVGQGGLIQGYDNKGNQIFYPISGEYDLALGSTDDASQLTKLNGKLNLEIGRKEKVDPAISYERTAFDLIKARKDEIVAPVRKAILEDFRNQAVNGKKITMNVSGIDFATTLEFKKAVEGMKGITEARQDEFKGGVAYFRVTFLGSAQDFAALVASSTFKKKKLNVVSVTGNTLEVQVAK